MFWMYENRHEEGRGKTLGGEPREKKKREREVEWGGHTNYGEWEEMQQFWEGG